MKLLSVFFLLVLISLSFALNEDDSCEFDDDCDGGQHCTSYFTCKHGRRGRRGFVDDDDSYQCNPKCAEGLACYHGICVDGN